MRVGDEEGKDKIIRNYYLATILFLKNWSAHSTVCLDAQAGFFGSATLEEWDRGTEIV
jgi:hypothetical protein